MCRLIRAVNIVHKYIFLFMLSLHSHLWCMREFRKLIFHFALIYTADHILLVLPIKDLINEDIDLTTTFKLATGMKTSILHWHVLFFPCVVRKATAHVRTNAFNVYNQEQTGFHGIFVGIPQHQKGYLVYVTHKRKIVSSYEDFLWEFL